MEVYPMSNIAEYTDLNKLVAPNRVPAGTVRGSDNGVTHTSRYLMLTPNPPYSNYFLGITKCITTGYVQRAPDDFSENMPDDSYSVISLFVYLDIPYPFKIPSSRPHPVLIYLKGLARRNFYTPLLSPLVALIVAFSNIGNPGETSNRLLTWTTCQALKRRTFLPGLAARFWEYRQKKTYGKLSEMFRIYYGAEHPLTELARARD